MYNGETLLAEGNEVGWMALAPLISTHRCPSSTDHRIERVEIGSINADIEQTRLKIRAFELDHLSPSEIARSRTSRLRSLQWNPATKKKP